MKKYFPTLTLMICLVFACNVEQTEPPAGRLSKGGLSGQEELDALIEAAESGDARAQMAVGNAFSKRGNQERAMYWYEKAAAQGHRGAMYNVAMELVHGDEQDRLRSRMLFRTLAEEGDGPSQAYLAAFYKGGVGGERDLIEAYKWYTLAAQGGDSFSAGQAKRLRRRLNSAQLADAEERVAAFLEKRERR